MQKKSEYGSPYLKFQSKTFHYISASHVFMAGEPQGDEIQNHKYVQVEMPTDPLKSRQICSP